MNVFEKLNAVREEFLKTEHKKTGGKAADKKAYFSYFELSDFLPEVLALFSKNKLYGHFSVIDRTANLEIINVESPEEKVVFSMPFGSAKLSNCHEIQNIGACITYARRYLWGCAIELTENDSIDGSTSRGEKPENFDYQEGDRNTDTAVNEQKEAMQEKTHLLGLFKEMRNAKTVKELMSIFGPAWNKADGSDKLTIESEFKRLKATMENKNV